LTWRKTLLIAAHDPRTLLFAGATMVGMVLRVEGGAA
jgi:hypothetical protein